MELKPIPGTLGFLADSEGNIYDPQGNKRNTYRNGDGYITASVLTKTDGWVTFGVHRLVAWAFHGIPEGERDQLNHRDLNILNARADNLEWVSVEENIIHAHLMERDNHKPRVYAVHRDKDLHKLFLNAWDAADFMGLQPLDIWDSIKDGKLFDGWQCFYQRYSANIPKEVQRARMPEKKGVQALPKRAVKFRDIDSGIIIKFPSIADAARHFNVGLSAIHQAIPRRDVVRRFKKKYQVAYEIEDFQELSEEDWERAKNTGPRDVVAYHYPEKRIYFFQSGVAFLEHSKLSKKAVTTALAKNKLRRIGNWVALYYTEDVVDKLLEFAEGSSPSKDPE